MARRVPEPGDRCTFIDERIGTVCDVDGRTITVALAGEGAVQLRLHPLTAAWVQVGEPYWGYRLQRDPASPGDGEIA